MFSLVSYPKKLLVMESEVMNGNYLFDHLVHLMSRGKANKKSTAVFINS